MERTLVLIKPNAIQRGLMGEIISRFEKKGLRIVGMKMMQLTDELLAQHYAHLKGKPFFPILCKSMMRTPVVALCLEGLDVVTVVRRMSGNTNGRQADPGTIRGDYSVSNQENVVHTSDSLETAQKEIERFFLQDELFELGDLNITSLYADDEL